jgi:hypothetical protein
VLIDPAVGLIDIPKKTFTAEQADSAGVFTKFPGGQGFLIGE